MQDIEEKNIHIDKEKYKELKNYFSSTHFLMK